MEFDSGECLYKNDELRHVPIASVCKVMTLALAFDAVQNNQIGFDDVICVSERAASMGGSQVFLQAGCEYPLKELIKSIVVCSANDSCVAVAETVCASEEAFVQKMNEKAKELGCNDTLYANCTGLPKPTQYSCAADVAKTFRYLIQHDAYFNFSKIWLEDFSHPNNRITQITNTNKLLRKYTACDGGKTGFTNEAGFCLAATATKNNMRLISVVLGADSSDMRFQTTAKLFDYGFANYKNQIILDNDVNLNDKFGVIGGKKQYISVHPENDCYVLTQNNQTPEITNKVIQYKTKAPVAQDAEVGEIEIYKDGILYKTVKVLASERVDKASFFDVLRDVAMQWSI